MRRPRVAGLTCIAVAAGLAAACGRGVGDENGPPLDPALVLERSRDAATAFGDAIGQTREARFLDDGERVLILDRYPPFLRLFTTASRPLWAGGAEGGGPRELADPQSIAVSDDEVLVLQPGRISRWRLESDSLAFVNSRPLPGLYFPLGAEIGCDGQLILYARNERQFSPPPDSMADIPEVEFLHEVAFDGDSVRVRPLWGTDRQPTAIATLGHNGVLLDRTDSSIVLLHRYSYHSPGEIVEFDCSLRSRRTRAEKALITGDDVPALAARQRPLQWTAGIVALGDGFLMPIHRYYSARHHGVPEPNWKTEVFRFREGRFAGTVLLEGQWTFVDHHPRAGVLLITDEPVPHFVVVPVDG